MSQIGPVTVGGPMKGIWVYVPSSHMLLPVSGDSWRRGGTWRLVGAAHEPYVQSVAVALKREHFLGTEMQVTSSISQRPK